LYNLQVYTHTIPFLTVVLYVAHLQKTIRCHFS